MDTPAPIKNKKCVICNESYIEDKYLPFCSRRCKLRDLNRWLSGAYAVPTEEAPSPEEETD